IAPTLAETIADTISRNPLCGGSIPVFLARKSCYTKVLPLAGVVPDPGRSSAVFFHVRDLELKPVGFDVELPPGTIEFLDPKLKQAAPLHASGKGELVMGSLGEIRVTGHVKVRLQAEC